MVCRLVHLPVPALPSRSHSPAPEPVARKQHLDALHRQALGLGDEEQGKECHDGQLQLFGKRRRAAVGVQGCKSQAGRPAGRRYGRLCSRVGGQKGAAARRRGPVSREDGQRRTTARLHAHHAGEEEEDAEAHGAQHGEEDLAHNKGPQEVGHHGGGGAGLRQEGGGGSGFCAVISRGSTTAQPSEKWGVSPPCGTPWKAASPAGAWCRTEADGQKGRWAGMEEQD